MRVLKIVGIVVLSFIVIVVGVAGGLYLHDKWRTETQQEALAAFYTPPDPISGDPGTVLRSELAPQWDVAGGTASRILYVTQGTNGEPRVTGGMVWIPSRPFRNTSGAAASLNRTRHEHAGRGPPTAHPDQPQHRPRSTCRRSSPRGAP